MELTKEDADRVSQKCLDKIINKLIQQGAQMTITFTGVSCKIKTN